MHETSLNPLEMEIRAISISNFHLNDENLFKKYLEKTSELPPIDPKIIKTDTFHGKITKKTLTRTYALVSFFIKIDSIFRIKNHLILVNLI